MRVLSLFLAVALCGCGATGVKRIGTEEYPPRPEKWPIGVFTSSEAPRDLRRSFQYQVGKPDGKLIGRSKITTSLFVEWDRAVFKAKNEARKMGGDAIYILTGGSKWTLTSDITVDIYRYPEPTGYGY